MRARCLALALVGCLVSIDVKLSEFQLAPARLHLTRYSQCPLTENERPILRYAASHTRSDEAAGELRETNAVAVLELSKRGPENAQDDAKP